MTSGGLKANTVFGNTANSNVETGDTSFLTDFSQSANGGMIDTNDVDPIAEAEVYMAYGRDAQAEEILKDAIAKEPKRHELHLKLLEMYAASKNLSAFETIAGELYTSLGAEDPTWAKVAEIGIKLEPNNPLYQANSHPPGMGEKLDASDFSDSPLAAEKDLDFSFDNQSLVQDFASDATVETQDSPLERADLSFGTDKEAPSHSAEVATVGALAAAGLAAESFADEGKTELAKDDNLLDFDIAGFGEPSIEAPSLGAPVDSAVLADDFEQSMPSLDIPTFAAPQFMPEELDAEEIKSKVSSEFNADFSEFESSFPSTMTPEETGVFTTTGLGTTTYDTNFTQAETVDAADFNFDIALPADESTETLEFKDADFSDVNTFDLTTINLDLDESAVKTPAETAGFDITGAENATQSVHAAAEPIEVETKLDLVAAYIEMDDKEGAKELLEEVMKEGGVKQRKRAEEFLVKLA